MASNSYEFVTRWRAPGSVEDVYALLSCAQDYACWWPDVYIDVHSIVPGDENGIGMSGTLLTRGWLPYRLRWTYRVTDASPPHCFTIEANGDLAGRGTWRLMQDGDEVDIHFDWIVCANKPLLKYLSWLFKPLFAANHTWAMRRGQQRLCAELARRRAKRTSITALSKSSAMPY